MFDTMVIPLDGSPFAADALPIGAALARDAGAGLRVVGIARSDAELALTYDARARRRQAAPGSTPRTSM